MVSSITCMATPCTVAVVTSAGSDMSCSKSDFSIDLNVETLCPSQVGYTCEKRGTEPARTEALASPPANKLSPRYAQASTVCLAGLKLPDFGARTKANAFNILISVAKIGILPEKTGNITKKAIGKIPIALI